MKLLVRHLPRTTTEDDIRALFSNHGKVDECNLVLDQATNQSKGFAFVEMPNEKDANNAINSLHMHSIEKNKIRVKLAQD